MCCILMPIETYQQFSYVHLALLPILVQTLVHEIQESNPWNLYMKFLHFFMESIYLQKCLFLQQNLVLKVAYLHNSMLLEQVVAHQANPFLLPASAPLAPLGFKIVVPFCAMFATLAHLIPSLVLERFVVLCWTQGTLTSPSVFVVIVFSTTMLLVEG